MKTECKSLGRLLGGLLGCNQKPIRNPPDKCELCHKTIPKRGQPQNTFYGNDGLMYHYPTCANIAWPEIKQEEK